MSVLTDVTISFHTHNAEDDNRNKDTILHVFIKNRSNTSSDPEGNTDFISNLLAYQEDYNKLHKYGENDLNPYIAFGKSLSQGLDFPSGSNSTEFHLTLRSKNIQLEEIILPVVNIHILPNGSDRWKFDYTVKFIFDHDQDHPFQFSSNINGVKGIILNQHNRDYSGIGVENPNNKLLPQITKPDTDAVLTKVTIDFGTHNNNDDDDNNNNKNADTVLNVYIANRISASESREIVNGTNILPGIDSRHLTQTLMTDHLKVLLGLLLTSPLVSN